MLSLSVLVLIQFAVVGLCYSCWLPVVFRRESRRSCPPPQVLAAILWKYRADRRGAFTVR